MFRRVLRGSKYSPLTQRLAGSVFQKNLCKNGYEKYQKLQHYRPCGPWEIDTC